MNDWWKKVKEKNKNNKCLKHYNFELKKENINNVLYNKQNNKQHLFLLIDLFYLITIYLKRDQAQF